MAKLGAALAADLGVRRTERLRVLPALLLAELLFAMSAIAGSHQPAERLTISVLQFPWQGGEFLMTVAAGGAAEARKGARVSRRTLSADELHALRGLLVAEKVLEIRGELGTCYIDGLIRNLDVKLGRKSTNLTLCSLDLSRMGTLERDRSLRALRMWVALRSLFSDTYPSEERASDEQLLAGP